MWLLCIFISILDKVNIPLLNTDIIFLLLSLPMCIQLCSTPFVNCSSSISLVTNSLSNSKFQIDYHWISMSLWFFFFFFFNSVPVESSGVGWLVGMLLNFPLMKWVGFALCLIIIPHRKRINSAMQDWHFNCSL